jgi:hypothetical protein
VLNNYINVQFFTPAERGAGNALILRRVKFGSFTQTPVGMESWAGKPYNIDMVYTTLLNGVPSSVVAPSIVKVFDYNQITGNNFQVYYKEQAPSFILPVTTTSAMWGRDPGFVGAPVGLLTNAQAWSQYGMAVAGAVAPTNDSTTRPEINGFTAPIQAPTSQPRAVLYTPFTNANIPFGELIRIHYGLDGVLPVGAAVFFQLDNQTPFSNYNDGGIWSVSRGFHTLRAYIGNAQTGVKITGTRETSATFQVV